MDGYSFVLTVGISLVGSFVGHRLALGAYKARFKKEIGIADLDEAIKELRAVVDWFEEAYILIAKGEPLVSPALSGFFVHTNRIAESSREAPPLLDEGMDQLIKICDYIAENAGVVATIYDLPGKVDQWLALLRLVSEKRDKLVG